jgi:hypothetical protein
VEGQSRPYVQYVRPKKRPAVLYGEESGRFTLLYGFPDGARGGGGEQLLHLYPKRGRGDIARTRSRGWSSYILVEREEMDLELGLEAGAVIC